MTDNFFYEELASKTSQTIFSKKWNTFVIDSFYAYVDARKSLDIQNEWDPQNNDKNS